MSRVHCLDCGIPVTVDPLGRCPEGHLPPTEGRRVASAIGSDDKHPDEPVPWVGRVELEPVDEAPAVPSAPQPRTAPGLGPAEDAAAPGELLRELGALGLDGPASGPDTADPTSHADPRGQGSTNGHTAANGHATNGHATNGHATNGHASVDARSAANGYALANEHGVHDRAPNGLGGDGYARNGHGPTNGHGHANGHDADGRPTEGGPAQATTAHAAGDDGHLRAGGEQHAPHRAAAATQVQDRPAHGEPPLSSATAPAVWATPDADAALSELSALEQAIQSFDDARSPALREQDGPTPPEVPVNGASAAPADSEGEPPAEVDDALGRFLDDLDGHGEPAPPRATSQTHPAPAQPAPAPTAPQTPAPADAPRQSQPAPAPQAQSAPTVADAPAPDDDTDPRRWEALADVAGLAAEAAVESPGRVEHDPASGRLEPDAASTTGDDLSPVAGSHGGHAHGPAEVPDQAPPRPTIDTMNFTAKGGAVGHGGGRRRRLFGR